MQITPVSYNYTNQKAQNNNRLVFGAVKFPGVVREYLALDKILGDKNPAYFLKDDFMYLGTKQGSDLEKRVISAVEAAITHKFGSNLHLTLLGQVKSISTNECRAVEHYDVRAFDVE